MLNDFGVPGVKEHCLYLDSTAQAERIHQRVFGRFLRGHAEAGSAPGQRLRFAIVGAGATGVEFAAELRHAARQLAGYGLRGFDPDKDIEVRLIEAAPSVLPALPERLQLTTERELRALGVEIHTGEQVERVSAEGVHTRSGRFLPTDLIVWTAGIKGPAWLAGLDGLEVNRLGQLVVEQTLKVTRDEHIFAIGDCAACPRPGDERPVPPRAQAAHQQAHLLARSLARRLAGKPLLPFVYKDYGSLISLSSSTIGNLMGNLLKSITIEGRIARLAYLSLYKKHQMALHGLRLGDARGARQSAAPAHSAAAQAALIRPRPGPHRPDGRGDGRPKARPPRAAPACGPAFGAVEITTGSTAMPHRSAARVPECGARASTPRRTGLPEAVVRCYRIERINRRSKSRRREWCVALTLR